MTASAAELLGWDDIARRDLPWPNPGVTAWQILVSEFMLQQTPVARVQPSGSTGWRVAHAVGHGRHARGRRAAGLGQAGLTLACSVAITVSHSCSRFNAGTPTPPPSPHRSRRWAIGAATRPSVGYLQPFRETLTAPPPVPVAPTVRQVPGSLTRHPDRLTDDDRPQHKQILDRSEALTVDTQTSNRF
jgi:hypothetical protein